jgi:hypothetical protein
MLKSVFELMAVNLFPIKKFRATPVAHLFEHFSLMAAAS